MTGGGSSYTAEEVKAEVRQTIRQLSEMTRTEASFDQFCQEVLSRIVQLTGAHGALLWQLGPTGNPGVTHKAAGRLAEQISPNAQEHGELVQAVIESNESKVIPSSKLPTSAEGGAAYLMLFAPIFDRQKNCCGSIELLQRSDVTQAAQEGYLRFLSQIAQLFPRWHEHQDLERLTVDAGTWNKKIDYITEIHKSLDLDETCYAIANEVRRLLKADRVSVAKWNGSSCKVKAISSQDRFDNRANVVRKLGYVATSSVSADTSFWIIGDTEGIAPEVASQINDYLDESHCRTLAVLPLVKRPPDTPDLEMDKRKKEHPEKLGALIVEYFDADIKEEEIHDLTKLAVSQAEWSMDNARQHSEIFLLPFWRRMGQVQKFLFKDHYSKAMTGLVALGLLLLTLIFYHAPLKMKVDGVMQPEIRRNLFAQTDGVIKEVFVEGNQFIEEGTLMATMTNFDLELEIQTTTGSIKEIQSEMSEVSARFATDAIKDEMEKIQLGGQLDQYQNQLNFYQGKLETLDAKTERLKIIAPVSGIVTTWDTRRLVGLPRNVNQLVMSIADTNSKWQIEVRIPQNKIGYVSRAQSDADGKPLEVEFVLGTNANTRIRGELVQVANRAEMSDAGVPEFRAIVDIDTSGDDIDIKDLRPGAGVTAKIICNREPLGFVWFHQVIDFLRTNVFF